MFGVEGFGTKSSGLGERALDVLLLLFFAEGRGGEGGVVVVV